MMKNPSLFICVLAAALLVPKSLHAQGIARVWAVDDGERIKKTVLNHPLATSSDNKIWNGTSISLFGARNEVIAFQLIIQGNSSGATNVNVTLDSLHKSSTPKYTIKNTGGIGDPYNYVGKRIEMFVEHYMDITARSSAGTIWWSSARPLPDSDFVGLVPEMLVPFEAPAGPKANGQGGAPFSVTASQNQAVWVDVYVPRDALAGDYIGVLKVTENGIMRYSIPVSLKVYGFTLSDTTHFRSMFHIDYPELAGRHGVANASAQYWELMKRYYAMGHRHRADVTDGRLTLSAFTTNLGSLYSGSYYGAAGNYDGPGSSLGNRTYSIGTYDQPRTALGIDHGSVSGFTYNADTSVFRATWWTASNEWMSWFEANAPSTLVFKYMAHEPGLSDTSIFFDIRRKARWLQTNPGPGRRLKTLCTTNIRPDLRGSIDIWMGTGQSGYVQGDFNPYPGGYVIDSADAVRALGDRAGMYNGSVPAFAAHVIDAPGSQLRVDAWIAWKHNVDLYFLWHINHWGAEDGDPIDPWLADRRTHTTAWGDGSFMYAGENKNSNLSNDRGLGGPIAGIRLKNWRRGAQDYEYLYTARQLGINTNALVYSLVPAAFEQVNQASQATYPSRGWQYEDVRRQLAELIAGATSPLPYGLFIVLPDTLTSGPGNVTLQWVSTNATSATINNGVGAVPLSGTRTVFVDTTTTFVLTLTNSVGSRGYAATVTVRLLPSGSFNASPDTLPAPGGTTMLTWTSSNALSARIDPGVGPVNLNGSRLVVVSELTEFTLTLTNSDGSQSYSKRVFIRTLPLGTFTVTPDTIEFEGGEVGLAWTSTNAVTASLNHGIGNVPLSDSVTLFLATETEFSLTLTNPFGARVYTRHVYRKPFRPRIAASPASFVVQPVLNDVVYPFTFSIFEASDSIALYNIDISASDLTDEFGNSIPSTRFVLDSTHISYIPPGDSAVIHCNFSVPASLIDVDTAGLFTGQIAVGGTSETEIVYVKLGSLQQTVSVSSGWNIISVPNRARHYQKDRLFPSATSAAFGYQGEYAPRDPLANGPGYWLKFSQGEGVTISGNPLDTLLIRVAGGWNLVGSISDSIPVSWVGSIPSGIITSAFFGYSPEGGGYHPATHIAPGKGYWVKTADSGYVVVMPLSFSGEARSGAIEANALKTDFNTLLLSDSRGSQQRLYFGSWLPRGIDAAYYQMPPPPPQGALDARFSSGRMVEVAHTGEQCEFPLRIASASFPVTIAWELRTDDVEAHLRIGNAETKLGSRGSTVLSSLQGPLVLKLSTSNVLPVDYALEQNYPNPFNPVTSIKYELPADSRVTLEIFDVIGKSIKTLVDEVQSAGYKTADWDSRNSLGNMVASGLYLYRLEATSLSHPSSSTTQVRKMLLLR